MTTVPTRPLCRAEMVVSSCPSMSGDPCAHWYGVFHTGEPNAALVKFMYQKVSLALAVDDKAFCNMFVTAVCLMAMLVGSYTSWTYNWPGVLPGRVIENAEFVLTPQPVASIPGGLRSFWSASNRRSRTMWPRAWSSVGTELLMYQS